jgi:hypothetical protein
MSTQNIQIPTGGFAGDPAEALTPPPSAGGCCGSTPANAVNETDPASCTCCGTAEQAAAEGSCCGTAAKVEAVAVAAGCCG